MDVTPPDKNNQPSTSEPMKKSFLKSLIKSNQEFLTFIADIVLNIVIIVGLVFIIRTFVISPFQIFGPSMCDTLNNINNECQHSYGEYIIVNKFIYQNFFGWQVGMPQRGDIIVFHPPQNENEFFIKRIIGLPGETVQLKNGKIYITNKEHPEGFELDENIYLNDINEGNTRPYREDKTIFEVPQGKYFALGDNRIASSDSRSCFKETAGSGFCEGEKGSPFLGIDHIEGKAWLVLWPISKLAILQNPAYPKE